MYSVPPWRLIHLPTAGFKGPYAPYFYRTPHGTDYVDLTQSYDYSTQDWFQIPRELGKTEWSEPYYDEGGGNALMATCSVPFYETGNGQKRFAGIVTSDVSLKRLTDIVSVHQGFENGLRVSPVPERDVSGPSPAGYRHERVPVQRCGRSPQSGTQGHRTPDDRRRIRLHSLSDPFGCSKLDLLRPDTLRGLDPGGDFSQRRAVRGYPDPDPDHGRPWDWRGLLLLTLVIVLIARSITTPIRALAGATGENRRRGFCGPHCRKFVSKDEVGGLTRDFHVMRDSLTDHIRQLTETTIARGADGKAN